MGRYHGLIACLLSGSLQAADSGQAVYAPGIDLPDDNGKALILKACTRCHDLKGVPAYRKYWGFDRWLPMVENMIEHGAKLNDEEKITVARYLGKHFGIDG